MALKSAMQFRGMIPSEHVVSTPGRLRLSSTMSLYNHENTVISIFHSLIHLYLIPVSANAVRGAVFEM